MAVFLLNGVAVRADGWKVRASSMTGTVIAASAAEALGRATLRMQSSYPNADGWSVQIEPPVEMTEATLRELLAATGAQPLTLPPDLAARLEVVASAKGRTMDELVIGWLTRQVEIAEAGTKIREAAARARGGQGR